MVIPLDTYGLDTWHLPTADAKGLLLSLLSIEAKGYEATAGRPAEHVHVIIDWLANVPTRGDA